MQSCPDDVSATLGQVGQACRGLVRQPSQLSGNGVFDALGSGRFAGQFVRSSGNSQR